MSDDVETLRQAAVMMRERALEATGGAWSAYDGTAAPTHIQSRWTDEQGRRCTQVVAEAHGARSESQAQDAAHITSWQPAIAAMVAELLSVVAAEFEHGDHDPAWACGCGWSPPLGPTCPDCGGNTTLPIAAANPTDETTEGRG